MRSRGGPADYESWMSRGRPQSGSRPPTARRKRPTAPTKPPPVAMHGGVSGGAAAAGPSPKARKIKPKAPGKAPRRSVAGKATTRAVSKAVVATRSSTLRAAAAEALRRAKAAAGASERPPRRYTPAQQARLVERLMAGVPVGSDSTVRLDGGSARESSPTVKVRAGGTPAVGGVALAGQAGAVRRRLRPTSASPTAASARLRSTTPKSVLHSSNVSANSEDEDGTPAAPTDAQIERECRAMLNQMVHAVAAEITLQGNEHVLNELDEYQKLAWQKDRVLDSDWSIDRDDSAGCLRYMADKLTVLHTLELDKDRAADAFFLRRVGEMTRLQTESVVREQRFGFSNAKKDMPIRDGMLP